VRSAARNLPPDPPYRRADVARRIADQIRSDLHAGRLDEQLPYEWDLLRRYIASRGATREALRLLSDQGVLRRLPGVGTLRRVDRTANAAVADLLEIEPGAATLVNERVLETAEGLPIEFGFTRHRGDRSFFYAAVTDS
jgi:DNA-binding GntR family transcriptional regulator